MFGISEPSTVGSRWMVDFYGKLVGKYTINTWIPSWVRNVDPRWIKLPKARGRMAGPTQYSGLPKKTKRSNRLVGWYCFRVFGIFIILCCILCYSLYIVLHYIISIIILAITLLPTGFDDIWWADYYDKITFYFIGVYILWNGNPVLKQAGIPGDTSCSEGCFSLKKFNVLVITSAILENSPEIQ